MPTSIEQQDLIVKVTGVDIRGRTLYELVEPLRFEYTVNGGGIEVTVPKGFVTDFASIPRPLWSVFPPCGKYTKAAIVHDYLYTRQGCSRFLADAVFREIMFQLKVPYWKRILIYYAVRFFGGYCRTTGDNPNKKLLK